MVKLGILGTGKIVQELLPHLSETGLQGEAILHTEHSRAHAEALRQRYHIARGYTDYDAMLQSDIEAVYVALPNHLHFSFAQKAMQHGKHVICEKPMTAHTHETKALMECAAENHVMLFEGITLYHLPAYQKLCQDLHKIGRIRIVSLQYSQYSSRYDAFLKGTILPAFDWEKAGGALMDINIYNIHALLGLFGRPERVTYRANLARAIDTSGILLCEYPDFQAVCVGAKDCDSRQPSVIEGEEGYITIAQPLSSMTKYEIHFRDGPAPEVYEAPDSLYRMVYECRTFCRILETEDQQACARWLQNSLLAAQVLEEARRSAGIRFPGDLF